MSFPWHSLASDDVSDGLVHPGHVPVHPGLGGQTVEDEEEEQEGELHAAGRVPARMVADTWEPGLI